MTANCPNQGSVWNCGKQRACVRRTAVQTADKGLEGTEAAAVPRLRRAQAIQTAEVTSEKFFEAELYRLRGELLLTLGKRGGAEAGLRRALTIAQQQQARLLLARGSCVVVDWNRAAGADGPKTGFASPVAASRRGRRASRRIPGSSGVLVSAPPRSGDAGGGYGETHQVGIKN